MLLSASRRTDIPAFYMEWFLRRLRAGWLLVRSPYNPRQVSRVPLSREAVDCIAFWSKDPAPLLARADELDGFGIPYFVQFTLTPYGRELEGGLRNKRDILDTFVRLAERLGPDRVIWRYDPILLSERWTPARHVEAFGALCWRLKGHTDVCVISFVDMYAKLCKRAAGLLREPTEGEMRELAAALSALGRESGMELRACCERLDLTAYGIMAAGCLDRRTVERVCGYPIQVKGQTGQRAGCRCIESVDIGAYDTCTHGCVYCYANRGAVRAQANRQRHDPASPLLLGHPVPEDRISDRHVSSLRVSEQMSWFSKKAMSK